MQSLLRVAVLVTTTMLVSAENMDTVYQWKYVDYVWDSDAHKQQAIQSGDYNYSQVVPMDVDVARDGRVFLTFDGAKGNPAVLATITDQMGPGGPLIKPYPDWSYFKKGDCNSIQSVYRIAIDECQRLWVLDNGYIEGQKAVCEAQLLAFNLITDRLIKRIKIPNHIARSNNEDTLLATPIVETNGQQCENTTVYMADTYGHGLVIWNNGDLYRLNHRLFGVSDGAENITSGNFSIHWPAGVVTMDLSPRIFPGEPRFLYFHSLASFDLYQISTQRLKGTKDGSVLRFLGAKNILSSQAVGVAFSSEGTFFMGLTKESAIACWNKYKQLKRENVKIIAQDNERLVYINGMKVIKNPLMEEELWALSNRLLNWEFEQYDFNDYNFRVLKKSVKTLVDGTICAMPNSTKIRLQEINREHGDQLIFST